MKTLLQLLIIAALATPAFAQNKKVVFLADRGKNSTTHAHESCLLYTSAAADE